ncbi:MAG: helix-turn-helix domain-containing protein [Actinomycetota bacterium]
MSEYERRRRAVQMRNAGKTVAEVARQQGRSPAWVYKTMARYKSGGPRALQDQSRTPRRQPQATPARMVRRIVSMRKALARRKGDRRFCGIGADAIAWELHLAGCEDIPAPRTIERIVARAGLTGRARVRRNGSDPRPYPAPVARRVGDVHQSDVVGPRHLATRRGPLRFYAYNTVDVAGGGIATMQSQERSADAYCRYLIEHPWERLGLPRVWQADNETVLAGFPGHPERFTAPVRLALLLGIEICFIPQGEPGRQAHVESFNSLWQERVLRRFRFKTLAALRRASQRFEDWFMERRPHPQLCLRDHGTRHPGALLGSMNGQVRHLPAGFSLDAYRNERGALRIPLARGRITWIRLVAEDGTIDIGGKKWTVGRRYAGQYVTATLSTVRRMLTVKLAGRVVKRHRFPITEPVVKPILERAR